MFSLKNLILNDKTDEVNIIKTTKNKDVQGRLTNYKHFDPFKMGIGSRDLHAEDAVNRDTMGKFYISGGVAALE